MCFGSSTTKVTKQDAPKPENQATSAKGVLQAALWMLENVGWTKGQSAKYELGGSKPVAFCASGALDWVQAPQSLKDQARTLLITELGTDIISFNDRNATRKRDVVSAFKRAIKKA